MNEKENAVANVIWQIVSNVVGGTANMGNLYKELNDKFDCKIVFNNDSVDDSTIYTKMYEELVKNTYDIDREVEEISRLYVELQGLAEAGYDVDLEFISMSRLYESMTGKKIDISSMTLSEIAEVNKYVKVTNNLVKGTKFISATGDVTTIVSLIPTVCKAVNLINEGKEDEAGKVLRDWGFTTLGSSVAPLIMMKVIAGIAVVNPLVTVTALIFAGFLGGVIGDFASDIFDDVFGLYDDAGAYTYPVDPLILDLDGDGIETISVEDGVNFDFDNNGFAEKTGWVGADDGLLVRDIDGNGQIDNGSELFGDMTSMEEDVASHGFEALQQFDTNGDNVIDQLDAVYSELRVWKDANQNGQVDEGELLTLEELGIAGLNLSYENIDVRDENGNSHIQTSTYIKADGSLGILEDVWFDKNLLMRMFIYCK